MAEDDDGNVDGAEDRKLMCLFEETAFPFQERPARVTVSNRILSIESRQRGSK